jgi:hypothetical protein
MGKTIGNVNVLDLRKATEGSVAEITRIGNVNLLLYSPDTAGLVPLLDMGNLNASVEVPPEAKVQTRTGQVVINRDFFRDQETPSFYLVTGQVMVEPDVLAEDIERGLGGLIVVGQVIAPEHLQGVIQSKIQQLIGQSKPYPALARVVMGSLDLDEHYLRALDDGSELAVVGSLCLPQVLPDDLLARKLGKLYASGGIVCHEENVGAIRACLRDRSGKVTTIPAGYELVGKSLVLDNALLASLPAKKLYCTERVQVAPNVTAATLAENLEGLVCEDLVLCPAALRSALAKVCNLIETRVIFYEGMPWIVDGEETLRPSRFEYLEGTVTLSVFGELTIDPDVEPRVLADRLDKVHNLGLICCTPEQMGAIEARLGMSDGKLTDSTEPKEEPEGDEDRIGNANYLAL